MKNMKLNLNVICPAHRTWLPALMLSLLGFAVFVSTAGEPAAPSASEKSGYHLFNRTPDDALREISTDRPDKTESPYTVDAGHFQIEMDVVSYTRNHDSADGADTVMDGFAIAPVNLKVGLFNDVDLQVMLDTYNHVSSRDRQAGTTDHQSGFGDVTVRLKKNFWGNDGGQTAFAMMPFIKAPTNQDGLGNRAVEGGIILSLAVELPLGWGMGLMTEFDFLRNDEDSGYHTAFVNTVTLSHDLIGHLGGYVDFSAKSVRNATRRGLARWIWD